MKICILADVQSAHTKRWVKSIAKSGHEVIVISFRTGQIEGIPCFHLKTPSLLGIAPSTPFWGRFHYLFAKKTAQNIHDEFMPDIVHAFWATSYGFLGARLKTKQFLVSVWGMDITDSPRNFIMRQLIKFTLKKAQKIFCTSKYLLDRTKPYVQDESKLVHIPFGIDTEIFKPSKPRQGVSIVLGSTKSFEAKYGLMNLIKAYEIVSQQAQEVKLLLVGSGSLKQEAEEYVKQNLDQQKITFLDAVDVFEIPGLLNKMDIFVMPSVSNSETFGVAALEASACGLPVIASRIGGIPEVIEDNITGMLIEPGNIQALAVALLGLVKDSRKRTQMGAAGRKFVQDKYLWENNVAELIDFYSEI